MVKHLLCAVLAGHGHVTPTLPLVAELTERGHRVDYACGPEFAEPVAAAGARWVPLPGLPPFTAPAEVGPAAVASWFRHFFAAHAATYPVLLEYCRDQRPDAVVYDATTWPARLAAWERGIPAVRTVPNLAANEAYDEVDQALTAGLDGEPETAALADDVARFAVEHDVELDVAATMDVTEALNLVFVPRSFQPQAATFDEDRFRFLGPMLGRRVGGPRWTPPSTDHPLLYVSLGSIFTDHPELYRTCLEAFDDDRWRVVMTIGDTDPAELGPLPAMVEVRSWFPQLDVLAHATGFLTHAGMGSTMEALYFGVPLLTLPQMPEQVVNADRVTELGLGRRLDPRGLSPQNLRRAVEDVTSDTGIRAALDRMQAEIHRTGGAAAGARAIEDHLR